MTIKYAFIITTENGIPLFILKNGKNFDANFEVVKLVNKHNSHGQNRNWTWFTPTPIIDSQEKLENRKNLKIKVKTN